MAGKPTEQYDLNAAPIHYGADEASAWLSGWNAAIEAMRESEGQDGQPSPDASDKQRYRSYPSVSTPSRGGDPDPHSTYWPEDAR